MRVPGSALRSVMGAETVAGDAPGKLKAVARQVRRKMVEDFILIVMRENFRVFDSKKNRETGWESFEVLSSKLYLCLFYNCMNLTTLQNGST